MVLRPLVIAVPVGSAACGFSTDWLVPGHSKTVDSLSGTNVSGEGCYLALFTFGQGTISPKPS
jgi:hypothetical protein